MTVHRILNSVYNSCTYLLELNSCTWLVDAGDSEPVIDRIRTLGKPVHGVLLTHGHFDHIYGLNAIVASYAEVCIITDTHGNKMLKSPKLNLSKYEGAEFVIDGNAHVQTVADGDTLRLDEDTDCHIMAVPGHDPSCLAFVIGNCIFTGDAYIPQMKTVVNLPYGNREQSMLSEKRIIAAAQNRTIYPGHYIR